MTHLEIPWKVVPCFTGPECWCRMIAVETYTGEKGIDENDLIIIGSASINTEMAEYIVNLHNESLNNRK